MEDTGNSFDGSVSASAGDFGSPGGDFGGSPGFGDSIGSGPGSLGGGIDSSTAGTAASGIGLSIAALGNLAMSGNPFAVINILVGAGMAYGPALEATRNAISFAYAWDLETGQAPTQLSAFTQ